MPSWPGSPLLKTIVIYFKPDCNTTLLNFVDFLQGLEVSCLINSEKKDSGNVTMNLQKRNENILSFDPLDHLSYV